MSDILPPNSCLVAVLLVVKTKSEPRLAFHYPPKPGEESARFRKLLKEEGADDDSDSSSDDPNGTSADEPTPVSLSASPKNGTPPEADEAGSVSPEKRDSFGEKRREKRWNDLFGFESSVLAKLLCPQPATHRKRTEFGMNGKVFVGQPVFAGVDGAWKKQRKRRSSSKSTQALSQLEAVIEEGKEAKVGEENLEEIKEDAVLETDNSDAQGASEMEVLHIKMSEQSVISVPQKPKSSLSMFHVVFVLDPPPLEYPVRVKEMYDHVAKKFTKALRYEQARSHYVTEEVALINSTNKRMKVGEGNESSINRLYHDLITQSSLAKAMGVLYNNISTSQVAHINLNEHMGLSLQLPIPSSIPSLPSPLATQLPGLWLSTAPLMSPEPDAQGPGSQLNAHFGLLLLSDTKRILDEIQSSQDPNPFSELMAHFLRVTTPTKSFYQISQRSGLSLHQVQILAFHLIQWRKARAIPPLNQRDTYIVSPNADFRNLLAASASFAKLFPALPALPNLMSMLSGTPKPYAALIPSRDHKEAYMNILAWLLRSGWVTQLRSFAWVRLPPHITTTSTNHDRANGSSDNTTSPSTDQRHSTSSANPSKPSPSQPENADLSSSPQSVTTAVLIPSQTPQPHRNPNHPKHSSPSSSSCIIPNPRTATAAQQAQLSLIAKHIGLTRGEESVTAWEACVGYFDGKTALESVAVIQGWKKKRMAELVGGWEGEGVLLRVRHW